MLSYTPTGLVISEVIQTNCVFWVHSLPASEFGPTRRILDDLEALAGTDGFRLFEHSVANRQELISVLAEIARLAEIDGYRPVLHIDCHGTVDEGLLLAPSGERLSWKEIIALIRTINVATQNNLVCIFALCFGLRAYQEVELKKPVPAYLFAGPAEEVSVGFLEDETLAFYRRMAETNNVTAAFSETLGKRMTSFHCQGLFLEALLRYIRFNARGKGRKARVEGLTTAVLRRDGDTAPSHQRLAQIRRDIKAVIQPGQSLIISSP